MAGGCVIGSVGYLGGLSDWSVTYGTDPLVQSVTLNIGRVSVTLSLDSENVFNFSVSLRLDDFFDE